MNTSTSQSIRSTTNGDVTIEIGKEYVINAPSPRNKRNGRHVRVLDFVRPFEDRPDVYAKVRYVDNNRVGRVDLGWLSYIS